MTRTPSRPGPDTPIDDSELQALFATVASRQSWALAVSGGIDSMVLLHLVQRWLKGADGQRWRRGHATFVLTPDDPRPLGAPAQPPEFTARANWTSNATDVPALVAATPVVVLTVDHALRAGSADDTAFVADAAAAVGLPCAQLTWHRSDARPITSAKQEKAREARYGLIADAIDDEAWQLMDAGERRTTPFSLPQTKRVLLTAHHRDDQIETFLMRLARGSGVDGLSAMRPIEVLHHRARPGRRYPQTLELHRPLLDIPKSRLRATARAAGLAWRDDPTNADPRGERVALRQALERGTLPLVQLGLSESMVSLSVGRLQRARALTHATVDAALHGPRGRLHSHDGLFAHLDLTGLTASAKDDATVELGVNMVRAVLTRFGNATAQPSPDEIERLWHHISTGDGAARTLGGAVFDGWSKASSRPVVRVWRESGREGLEELTLTPGDGGWWDHRFAVSVSSAAPMPITIRALGAAGVRQLFNEGLQPVIDGNAIPRGALEAQPAAFIEGDVIGSLWQSVLSEPAHAVTQLVRFAFRPVVYPA